MHNQPLVSVIIPCYNASTYLDKAVNSILNQSYRNLEVWLIDDGSTDETSLKIKSFNDTRVRKVFFKENTKKIGAVNDTLRKVNGTFICFQDADDWSNPNKIFEQVEYFEKDRNIGICFTGYTHIGKTKFTPVGIALTDQELKDEFLNFGNRKNGHLAPTICATMMISKEVLNETNGYNSFFSGRVAEDIHWVYRILRGHKGGTIPLPLYNVQSTYDSLTHKQFTGKNAKAAYSWNLLSKIIYKDIYENMDVLAAGNENILKELELEACESALIETIKLVNKTKDIYESSRSFKLGKLLLAPFRLFKK